MLENFFLVQCFRIGLNQFALDAKAACFYRLLTFAIIPENNQGTNKF